MFNFEMSFIITFKIYKVLRTPQDENSMRKVQVYILEYNDMQ